MEKFNLNCKCGSKAVVVEAFIDKNVYFTCADCENQELHKNTNQ